MCVCVCVCVCVCACVRVHASSLYELGCLRAYEVCLYFICVHALGECIFACIRYATRMFVCLRSCALHLGVCTRALCAWVFARVRCVFLCLGVCTRAMCVCVLDCVRCLLALVNLCVCALALVRCVFMLSRACIPVRCIVRGHDSDCHRYCQSGISCSQ